ncbi:MAG: prepilin-type N-terminal cleavage/methylation domain-containing protein [Fimbriimonadaceae bacterium]|nr:prepilin-type N-terminal cleavage/methylation domain-containing protein [Fimbriimonadaceae bacterium]
MRKKTRGATLPEILIVIAIIAILCVTLTLLLRPVVMRKSHETAIRVDLKQNVSAINLYMSDYDGNYPNYLHSLEGSYKYVKGRPELADYPGSHGLPEYSLTYNWGVRIAEKRRPLTTKFDPVSDPIVKAEFFPRSLGFINKRYFSSPKQGFANSISKTEAFEVLGGYLDGHVKWCPMLSDWEDEAAYYSMGAVKEEMDERLRARKSGRPLQ